MSGDWGILKLQLAALGGLLFLSLGVTWVILYYVRLLDHPNERSSHALATPKCGGVGIVLSFIAGVFFSQVWQGSCQVTPKILYSLVVPVLMVASVSLADDIHELSPNFRLIVHLAAAVLFLRLAEIGFVATGAGFLMWIVATATCIGAVLWIVGMANAFNFMDGIDGLAAGQGLIVAFFFSMIQIGYGNCFLGFVGLVLMVGCLGFLSFNFPPAKVFMGDVGSVSIGFILAVMALLSYKQNQTVGSLLVVPLLMSNFLFDTTITLFRRLMQKESLFTAHRSHLYQKFHDCGFSHRTVTMTNYGMVILQGLIVLIVIKLELKIILCLGVQICYFMAVSRWNKSNFKFN